MRVLHVAECGGGVDRYLRGLLKYSSCENIVVISQLYNKNEYEKIAQYVEVMNMKHGIGISAITEAFKLRKIIKKYRPDIVYAHSSIAGAITRIACISVKTKVIYNPHGWSFNMDNKKKKVYVCLERILSLFCDAIVCISEAEKKSAIDNKICRKEKLHVIYNGIDIDGYRKEKIEIPIPNQAFVVGMVGRICKQKAPDIFMKMASEVNKRIENVYFIIVGDVLEEDISKKIKIEEMAKENNVNLIITGWVNNPLAYMEKFDVGCLLSRWEGFGLVIPEYMLTDTPIVATRVDAIPYLIEDGVNGLLVEKDDWKAAAEKTILLIENEELRDKLKKNGNEIVKSRFDVKRVAKQSENLFCRMIYDK